MGGILLTDSDPAAEERVMIVPAQIRASILPIVVLALVAMLFAVASPAQAEAAQCRGGNVPASKLTKKRAKKAVLCLLNKQRRDRGMRALDRQGNQTRAAGKHNRVMIRKDCFSHQCPGESDLTSRLEKADYLPCGCSWGVAENIAYWDGRSATSRRIVDAWMHSSGHRMNILNGAYEHIGIAVSWGTPAGRGGRDSMTVTTDFGYRR